MIRRIAAPVLLLMLLAGCQEAGKPPAPVRSSPHLSSHSSAIPTPTPSLPRPTLPVGGAPTGAPTKTPAKPTTAPPKDVYYQNCAEVRTAGKAPLRRGQPGYRSGLDRDGDGIACDT